MRKLMFLMATGVILGGMITSCDNEPKNPGDFSVESVMSLGDVVSRVDGKVYTLKIAKDEVITFVNKVTVYDTIWDGNGEYLDREKREVEIPSKFTTRYVEYEPIMLSAYPDTFAIDVNTNAKWMSPSPTKPRGGSQFYSITAGGGGDGTMLFRSELNENPTRTVSAELNIYSQDSTVYHKVMLLQEGLK